MEERLDKRLVLNEWLFSQLGYDDTAQGMKQVQKILRDEPVGWDEQNVFHFRRRLELSLPEQRAIDNDRLCIYDRNIFGHWQLIVKKRRMVEHRDIYPLYFQYLALVFTEYFLDRWSFDRQQGTATLLEELNAFRAEFNTRFNGHGAAANRIDEYQPEDLTKLAFWIATGGGKTLIMHCNIRQLNHYIRERGLKRHFNKYILITPNEGLTEQHLEEFALSGIPAERYQKDDSGLFNQAQIEVIEITKLKEKTGVTTVAVDEFGRNNVVMVDEGHRGAGGDEWFQKRQALCSEGFSFEYSATFGQSVNALSERKKKEMSQLYAKSVLFDYSYKFFYGDGYGKDFHILNYSQESETPGEDMQKLYLSACLLRFYQQCRLYKDRHAQFASYLVDDPLMVFVGGSVTGQRQAQHDTDVVTALKFFADFLADEAKSVCRLDQLLRQQDGLQDGQGLVFGNAFDYVRELFPLTSATAANDVYQDILAVVFNATGGGLLHAVHLKGSGSEIGLRIGEGGEYFGVINVGEPKKLWDMLVAANDKRIVCAEQEFSISLFDNIKEPGSRLRLLVGAKKFTEGWSCWRVSCMGLINIGRKEGSQIIQLFGRGVRLKGMDFLLKRSTQLPEHKHPKHIEEIETLNIFGIRADYTKVFNEYIDDEDLSSVKKVEIIHLPTIENLARTDLKVILPRRDMPDFKQSEQTVFGRYDKIRTSVSADWYGRLDSKTSRYRLRSNDEARLNRTTLKPVNLKFLDFDRLYLDLLHFKKQSAMYNLEISQESIRALLGENDWYDLFIPEHMLEFTGFERVQVWQEIAADLLKKYCRKYYDFRKDEFEGQFQEYRSIHDILADPDERFNKQFLQNLRIEYQAAVDKSQEQLIRDLKQIEARLCAGQLQDYSFGNLAIFCFDRHLYQPLIHVKQGAVGLSIKPTQLNKHEKQFVEDLKAWCNRETNGTLENRELYVLRNQSRGKGVSFFDEGNFYPDFILWLFDGDRQHIIFADPHGLQHARGFSDSKLLFSKRIKQIEAERLRDRNVCLDAFILSPTAFSEIKYFDDSLLEHRDMARSKARFLNHHILFMYDDPETYISTLFSKVLASKTILSDNTTSM
jgi:hypothetical protein